VVETAAEASRRRLFASDHHLSVVIPTYNNSAELVRCLDALLGSSAAPEEIIVVDDGSEETLAVDQRDIRFLRLEQNRGAAAARNHGARHARGDVLFFVDADVVPAPDATERVAAKFAENPGLGAVFGSYDANPAASGVVSQFRNLLHHFTHQRGRPGAATFWAGCGAVRRSAFEAVGGFDESSHWRAIEDIELGYRLHKAGYRIVLDRDLLGTHLKKWTLRSLIVTDTVRRAVPWTRLILESGTAPRDLNLTASQRWSVALVASSGGFCLAALLWAPSIVLAVVCLSAVAVLNREFYSYLANIRGVSFVLASFPLHLLYFLCSALGFLYGWLAFQVRRRLSRADHGSSTR
jgi:GT2 family glycosyltransferase